MLRNFKNFDKFVLPYEYLYYKHIKYASIKRYIFPKSEQVFLHYKNLFW